MNNKFFLPNHSITWTAHASHLCAGGEEYSDTCEGDGGGPLVCAAVPETIEDEEISAGEGGAGTVDNSEPDQNDEADEGDDYTDPDPIFGEFKPDYDGSEDLDDDDVFGDDYPDEYPDEDTNVFESDNLYDDYPCDDSEDTLGLRESALCKKGARSSPGESGKVTTKIKPDIKVKCCLSVENDNDALDLRTVEKKKRSANPQASEDLFDYYDYGTSDQADDGNSDLFNQYTDIPESVGNRDDDVDDIRLVQLGVVAWGIGCGRAGLPSVYSSVASARCWLDQVMSCYQPSAGTGDLKTSDSGRM